MNRKGILGRIIFIVVLLVFGFFWFLSELPGEEKECVRVEPGCCGCSSGGEEICVLESEAQKIEEEKNCSEDIFCATVYACEIESCEYVDGECIAK